MGKSYKNIVKIYSSYLKNITNIPQKEIELILLFLLKKDTIWLHINYDNICDENIEKKLKKLVKKRVTNYPLEYILKKVSFYSDEFDIFEGVLIPRPQTEILIKKAFDTLKDIKNPKIVEIGTGSGVISIILAKFLKNATIVAVDINKKALILAKQNAIKHKVDKKIKFIKSDIFDNLTDKSFDIAISNPPYIALNYNLPTNVCYEPSNALFGGIQGDELLKKIISKTNKHNIKYLLCEMGYDQKKSISQFLDNFDTKNIQFYKDLEGFDRGFVVEFSNQKD
jgi:release factor glutamine methyltransferase